MHVRYGCTEVGGSQGGRGKVEVLFGAVRTLCRNSPFVWVLQLFCRGKPLPGISFAHWTWTCDEQHEMEPCHLT